MPGPEDYKEFDNASIITTTTSGKDSVSIGKFTFRKRDVLLGGIAIVALLGVIILAIVLAAGAGKKSCDTVEHAQNSGHTATAPTSAVDDDKLPYCLTPQCLKAALYQKPIMNQNVNPCDNFYAFACGQYATHHEKTQFLPDVTPVNEIRNDNTRRLVYMLSSNIENNHEHSYERKLKHFMKSCDNHFDKMDLRGTPLVEKIIKPLGGWYVFGTYDNATFDFHDLLKKIHIDYWSNAFFTLAVRTDQTNWNHKIVEFTFGGVRFNYKYYMPYAFLRPYQDVYKSYMKRIASLLSGDARMTPNDDRINQFVADAYEIESHIANSLQSVYLLQNNHHPDNKVTLGQLSDHMNNTVDMVDYMKALFNEWPSKFTADTKVALTVTGYFDQIGNLIATYMETEEGKRKLHNYLMWQVIDRYSHDLSWDYVHAKRRLNHMVSGIKDDSSGYLYCFNVASLAFPKAMSAVYVKQHIKDEGKNEAYSILQDIKVIMLRGIRKLKWMSNKDRDTAVAKIEDSLYKIGFPDTLADENYMDNYYYHLTINPDDFFANMLEVNKLHKKQFNNLIGMPSNKKEWAYHVYDPVIEFFNPWSELIVTAAMLQNPLFDPNGPVYYNYGGIGSRMASNLIHAIDEIGSQYKIDGSHFGSWWSNVTSEHYAEIRKCVISHQKDQVMGPFTDFTGNSVQVNTSMFARLWAPEVLADTSGIRMAYEAYKEKSEGKEKLPPGFHNFNGEQMFFITYAQGFCRNVENFITTSRTQAGILPSESKVNLAMRNIPEFFTAFRCPIPKSSNHCMLFGKLS